MLSVTPLGKQFVHPDDSVLGPLSRAVIEPDGTMSGLQGLNATYSQMIQDAFWNDLWDSPAFTPDSFTQMEANFSLFWGLAIQLYEATLISDGSPFDRWLGGETTVLTDEQKFGFSLFSGLGNCVGCHAGIEFTTQSAANIAFVNHFDHGTIELMFVSDGTQVIYDEGFNNTAVRPTTDDPGRGGTAPFINPLTGQPYPLAFSHLAEIDRQSLLPFETPILELFLPPTMPVNASGAFKVPGLRNVELTAPYFHNGGALTLEEVMDFYVRAGNFPANNLDELDPIIGAGLPLLEGNETMHAALVAFMKSLTDPRVVAESTPFDHPELFVPEGDPEVLIKIAATSATGQAALPSEITINPFNPVTNQTNQLISGTMEAGATVQVQVNAGLAFAADVINSTTWSATLTGLVVGDNTITVTSTGLDSVVTTITATITIDATPPALTINAVTTPTDETVPSFIFGTVEAGIIPVVTVDTAATVSPVAVNGTVWGALISGLAVGANVVTVTATDLAGNVSTLTATITFDTAPPALTINAVTSPTALTVQTISGTVEAGIIPVVTVVTAATVGPVTVDGTIWSATISGLTAGANVITVTASDPAGNVATITAGITVSSADGNIDGGALGLSDALTALRLAVGLGTPTAGNLASGDVAPLVSGVPAPDGVIDVGDALVILRKVAGLVLF